MKKNILIIAFFIILKFTCFGQNFVESNEFRLTDFDHATYFEKATKTNDYSLDKIFLVNKIGEKITEFEIFPESYDNDGIVTILQNTELKNVTKIIKIELSHCACYCETSKHYLFITNDNQLIQLPQITENIYDFDLKRIDYDFSVKNSDIIKLYEFQDEIINKGENSTPIYKLESKLILKSFKWNGKTLIEN